MLLIAVALMPGCTTPLQRFPPLDTPTSLGTLAWRQQQVSTVQATGTMELTSPDGRGARLEAAMVANPPTQLRLRGWKFDHAVIDLTLRDGETWVLAAESSANGPGTRPEDAARGLRAVLDLISGSFYQSAVADDASATSAKLVFRGLLAEMPVECTVDRPTLTARTITATDPESATTIALDRYQMVGGIAWPMRVEVRSPRGSFTLRFTDVELNTELSPAAFSPPGKAVRYP